MPRALFATLVILAVNTGLCAGQQGSQSSQRQTSGSTTNSTAKKVAALTPSPAFFEDRTAEYQLLELANQRRREVGAPALHTDGRLTQAACAHARLMVSRQELSHQFDGEASLMPRLLETGLPLDHVGENVAYNASAEKAFEALMQSPPHRRNLLDPDFNSAGFAAFWSGGRLYVVQDFAHQRASITQVSSPPSRRGQ